METTESYWRLVNQLPENHQDAYQENQGLEGKNTFIESVLSQSDKVLRYILDASNGLDQFRIITERHNRKLSGGSSRAEELEDLIDGLIGSSIGMISNLEDQLSNHTKASSLISSDSINFAAGILDSIVVEHQSLSQTFTKLKIEGMKSIVFNKGTISQVSTFSAATPEYSYSDEENEFMEDLDVEMKMELELENNVLRSQLDSYLSATQQAEQQIQQISELLTLFNTKLVEQREVITRIHDDAHRSTDNMERGNIQLKKTNERATNDIQLFLAYILAAILLIVYDM